MTAGVAIGIISQLLALCGLVSIRMFLPVFLYFLVMRLALSWPDYVPELIRRMAEHTPAWQTSTGFLTVFGVLAVVELAAVRNPDIKEFLVEDFDRYAKPVIAILLSLGVATTAQTLEVKKLLDTTAQVQFAAFGGFALAMMVMAGFVTGFCCRIRSAVLEQIQVIDPEDDLRLQSLSNWLGEIALFAIFLSLVFLPLLALALTGAGMLAGVLFQRLWAWYERRHSHPCTACAAAGRETAVSDCALICPECGTDQPDVRRVGWFGFSGSSPLDGMPPERHAFRLLAAHRCRWCASPLDRSGICPRCGRAQWTDGLRDYYVMQTDVRICLLLLLALLFFLFPLSGLGGLALVLILFRPLAVRPLATHVGAGGRFLAGLVMMFLKLLLLVPLVLLSTIPWVGLLVLLPFAGRYLFVRAKFLRATAPRINAFPTEKAQAGR